MNKIQLIWISIKAKVDVIYIPALQTFWRFQKYSWKSLISHFGIISGREVKSKGGYIYYQMEVSNLPLSKKSMNI